MDSLLNYDLFNLEDEFDSSAGISADRGLGIQRAQGIGEPGAVYYNEHALFPARWLRELATADAIPAGRIDRRSIQHVSPADVAEVDIAHFFAGIGVWGYALEQAGWPRSGLRTWTASLPCQPFSQAGRKRGFSDHRHLWPVFFRLVQQCKPSVLLGEQVASKDGLKWLDAVRADLEDEGYAFGALDLCAAGLGAPQRRQRIWWSAARMGDTAHVQRQLQRGRRPESPRWEVAARDGGSSPGPTSGYWGDARWVECVDGFSRAVGPGLRTLADGSPAGLESLRGYGNALNAEVAIAFVVAVIEALEGPGAIGQG